MGNLFQTTWERIKKFDWLDTGIFGANLSAGQLVIIKNSGLLRWGQWSEWYGEKRQRGRHRATRVQSAPGGTLRETFHHWYSRTPIHLHSFISTFPTQIDSTTQNYFNISLSIILSQVCTKANNNCCKEPMWNWYQIFVNLVHFQYSTFSIWMLKVSLHIGCVLSFGAKYSIWCAECYKLPFPLAKLTVSRQPHVLNI